MDKFDTLLGGVIDRSLGTRNTSFGYQYIEAEKYDAKRTYKHFLGYSPCVVTA